MPLTSRIRASLLLQLGVAMAAAFLILQVVIAMDYRGPLNLLALLPLLAVNLGIAFGLNRTPEAKLRSFVGSCIAAFLTIFATIALAGYAD
jgi:hypothetical protein